MTIVLTPSQEAWLLAHVASGAFASVEEALSRLLDEAIAKRDAETIEIWDWGEARCR